MIFRATSPAPTFSLMDAAIYGYRFLFRHIRYLALIGLLPLAVEIVSAVAMPMLVKDGGIFTAFLFNLPSAFLSGWFMFLTFRLALMGERIDRLPQDIDYLSERQHRMRVSVLIWVLFNMGVMVVTAIMLWSTKQAQQPGHETAMMGLNMFVIAVCFWAVRLGLLHFLAAVGYPLKMFIYKVNGVGISFRLIGLCILCLLPGFFAQQVLLMPVMPEDFNFAAMTLPAKSWFLGVTAVFSIILTAVLTGACAFALRQMLREEIA